MASEGWVIPGIVRDGVAVPRQNMSLPEGIPVEIHIRQVDLSPELESELAQWDKASAEAWAMIDEWEVESP